MALYRTSVKMVIMQVVRLTYRVTPQLLTAGKEKNTPDLSVKICCNID